MFWQVSLSKVCSCPDDIPLDPGVWWVCECVCVFLMCVGVGVRGSFEIVGDLMERSWQEVAKQSLVMMGRLIP